MSVQLSKHAGNVSKIIIKKQKSVIIDEPTDRKLKDVYSSKDTYTCADIIFVHHPSHFSETNPCIPEILILC